MQTLQQRTMVIEGRLEVCTMATLARYFEEFGTPARTKSDLLWQSCELLCQLLVTNSKIEPIDSIDEAYNYLVERLGSVTRAGRGRNMQIALQAEAIQRDGLSIGHTSRVTKAESAGKRIISDEEMQAAVREAAAQLGIKPIDNPS